MGEKRKRRHTPTMRKMPQDPHYFTQAGPVTVKTMAGEVLEERPALDAQTYREVVRERWAIPRGVRTKVYTRDKGQCRYCFSSVDITIDHVVPIAMGGSNRLENLVTACHDCNAKKGARVWYPRSVR